MEEQQPQHDEELLNAHRERLHALKVQAAEFGSSTPPHVLNEIKKIQSQIAALSPPPVSQTQSGQLQSGGERSHLLPPPEPRRLLRPHHFLITLLIVATVGIGLWQAWAFIQSRAAPPAVPPLSEVCPNRHETGERNEQFDIKVGEGQVAYYGGWGFDGEYGGFFVTIEGPYRGMHTLYNGVFCGPVAAGSTQAEAVRTQVESECENCSTRRMLP